MPESWGGLVALLGLVTPGLVYRARRERRHPARRETTFRETTGIALASLVLSSVALAIVGALAEVVGWLPDVGRWLTEPAYAGANYGRVAAFVALTVGLACGLAVAAEHVVDLAERRGATRATASRAGSRQRLTSIRAMRRATTTEVPAGARTWLWVALDDGTHLKGLHRGSDAGETDGAPEILLGHPLRWAAPATAGAPLVWTELPGVWDSVVVPRGRAQFVVVEYLDADGNAVHPTGPEGTPRG